MPAELETTSQPVDRPSLTVIEGGAQDEAEQERLAYLEKIHINEIEYNYGLETLQNYPPLGKDQYITYSRPSLKESASGNGQEPSGGPGVPYYISDKDIEAAKSDPKFVALFAKGLRWASSQQIASAEEADVATDEQVVDVLSKVNEKGVRTIDPVIFKTAVVYAAKHLFLGVDGETKKAREAQAAQEQGAE